jgi:feruloyl esterase
MVNRASCLCLAVLAYTFALPSTAFAAQSASASAASADRSCESLTSLKLPETTINAAGLVAAGPFAPPAPPVAGARAGAPLPVPSFCRVQLTVAPQINIEVWLPTTGWNGKFE